MGDNKKIDKKIDKKINDITRDFRIIHLTTAIPKNTATGDDDHGIGLLRNALIATCEEFIFHDMAGKHPSIDLHKTKFEFVKANPPANIHAMLNADIFVYYDE